MNQVCGLITEERHSQTAMHPGDAADIDIPVDIFFSQKNATSIVLCSNCSATEDVNVAVNNGEWIPYYWDEDLSDERGPHYWDEDLSDERGPLCPSCVEIFGIHFVFDGQTGEYVKGVIG